MFLSWASLAFWTSASTARALLSGAWIASRSSVCFSVSLVGGGASLHAAKPARASVIRTTDAMRGMTMSPGAVSAAMLARTGAGRDAMGNERWRLDGQVALVTGASTGI